mgnify:CR=1 FL=1
MDTYVIERKQGIYEGRNKSSAYKDLVWTVATSSDTSLDIIGQTELALVVIDNNLAELNSSKSSIVSAQIYIQDMNSKSFGFYLVYTNNIERKGFEYEPWHYSFAPLSKPYLEEYLKINLDSLLSDKKILGKEYFTQEFIENYVKDYVLDISPKLK